MKYRIEICQKCNRCIIISNTIGKAMTNNSFYVYNNHSIARCYKCIKAINCLYYDNSIVLNESEVAWLELLYE